MAALPAARSVPNPFAPVATVLGAMLLAVACVGWLLFFIHHIAQAISVNRIVDKIAAETEAMIDEMMPWPRRKDRLDTEDPLHDHTFGTAVTSQTSGYIRFVDTRRVVAVAKSYHVKVHVLRRVGHFIPAGVPLLTVYKGDRLTPEGSAALRGAFDLGPFRTLQQDVEFGVLQIVDIALRAISPAVNDPSTAISCVDQLSRILIRFASREPPESLLYDPPGVFRVSIPWIGFEKLLDSAVEQIRMYSKADVAVSLRMMRALGDIATTTPDLDLRQILLRRGQRIVDGCAENLRAEELKEMQRRLSTLEELTV